MRHQKAEEEEQDEAVKHLQTPATDVTVTPPQCGLRLLEHALDFLSFLVYVCGLCVCVCAHMGTRAHGGVRLTAGALHSSN